MRKGWGFDGCGEIKLSRRRKAGVGSVAGETAGRAEPGVHGPQSTVGRAGVGELNAQVL